MDSTYTTDRGPDSSAIAGLTPAQRERLAALLDGYLSELERGVPPDPSRLAAEHPDLAVPLSLYLGSLAELHDIAAGFADAAEAGDDAGWRASVERRLGDFILVREIGRGGMGVVYEARQESLGRRVALKVLPFASVLDSKQIARFKNEAQAAAQLHHPNIVPVFAVGTERGVHYYAMQFIDGQPLDEVIREVRRQAGLEGSHDQALEDDELAVDRAIESLCPSACHSVVAKHATHRRTYFKAVIQLGIDAAHAIHAAHEYGVVHRDIKPSNLLLDHTGKVWITDFGLARCQNDATLTRTGDVVGTMRYMSPEQAHGKSVVVDHRTDIYSLAVTLYELLTLHPVVPHDEPSGLPAGVAHEPRPLRRLCAEVPVDLETVVLKALARERDDRYATAREFADDLQRVLESRPTVARPPTVFERASKWARRHRRVVGAAAIGCLGAVIALAVMNYLVAREKHRAEDHSRRAEQRLRDAHDAVDRFGAQLAERLAGVGGAETLRHEVLHHTLRYYREFVRDAAGDPTLQADLALTYSKIGTLTAEIGSADEAIDAHRKALDLFRELVAADPHTPEYRRRLAMGHNNMALTLRRAGRIEEARQAHREAIALQQELARDGGDEFAGDLALSFTNLGLLQAETDEAETAIGSFQQAIRLQQRLVARDGDSPDLRRKLAASYNNLSAVYLQADLEKAAACYATALEHQETAATSNPGDLSLHSDWALTYNNLGALQSQTAQFASAAESYDHAIAIQRRLVAAAPARKSYRLDLAVSYNNHGLMQHKLGKAPDAEQSFEMALELQTALVVQYPNDLDLRSSLGGVYNNLGVLFEERQRLDEAAEAFAHAVEHQRIACTHGADVSRYRVFLSKHYYNYGRILRRLGRPDEAARSALARRELWPNDPQRLASIAEELALAGAALQTDPAPDFSAEQCARLAVETLRQAVAAGFQPPADLLSREPYALLKDHFDIMPATESLQD